MDIHIHGKPGVTCHTPIPAGIVYAFSRLSDRLIYSPPSRKGSQPVAATRMRTTTLNTRLSAVAGETAIKFAALFKRAIYRNWQLL